MQMGSPGILVTTIRQSSDGVLRNKDTVAPLNSVFVGYSAIAAVAARYATFQLFNPAGSGIITLIDSIIMQTDNPSNTVLGRYTTEITNDNGVWASRSGVGANGLSVMRSSDEVALLIGLSWRIRTEALVSVPVDLRYPFKLSEGEGVLVVNGGVNSPLHVSVSGREI